MVVIKFIWLRIGSCDDGNETSDGVKGGKTLQQWSAR